MNDKIINEIIEELKELVNNKRFDFYITTETAGEVATSLAKIKNIELTDKMLDKILEQQELCFNSLITQSGKGYLLSKDNYKEAIQNLAKYEDISPTDSVWHEINKYL